MNTSIGVKVNCACSFVHVFVHVDLHAQNYMHKWQADSFGRRKHISSWCWEGREGSTTCATIACHESALSPLSRLAKWQADAFGRHKHISSWCWGERE